MSFIRFSNYVINPAWIQSIEILPSSYKIRMSDTKTSGWLFFSAGLVDSYNKPLLIYKDKEPDDYELMSKWISNHSTIPK
jgi:hypothetical protein